MLTTVINLRTAVLVTLLATLPATNTFAGDYYREGVFMAQLEKPYEETNDPPPLLQGADAGAMPGRATGYMPIGAACCEQSVCGPDCNDCEEAGCATVFGRKMESRYNEMHRRHYFANQRSHRNLLYPVCPPYTTYGYGYHETCWRRMEPNRCPCPTQVPQSNPAVPAPELTRAR